MTERNIVTEVPDGLREIAGHRAGCAPCASNRVRTVERWEQGRSRPPDSAAALILMAQKSPDTFERLASL